MWTEQNLVIGLTVCMLSGALLKIQQLGLLVAKGMQQVEEKTAPQTFLPFPLLNQSIHNKTFEPRTFYFTGFKIGFCSF